MTVPVLTFFNNKGGVGKTSLVYHLAWMFSEGGKRVLACDLDPQANLTASFLDEDALEALWNGDCKNLTIHQCVAPLARVGELDAPRVRRLSDNLSLVPGDLALAGFEDNLSIEWPNALGGQPYRSFRILSAFWQVMQMGAESINADVILVDVGPNLGALNRSALIATDFVVAPLGADLFSLQGLRNLGPTLNRWRSEWSKRRNAWNPSNAAGMKLPDGNMKPIGYTVQQHGYRLGNPVKACDKWVNRMPAEYASQFGEEDERRHFGSPSEDCNCLATVKHYRSLVPMAQEARKPIFKLTSADGAIGAHAAAVGDAYEDFRRLAQEIWKRMFAGGDAGSMETA